VAEKSLMVRDRVAVPEFETTRSWSNTLVGPPVVVTAS